jgi:hypothetical protein
MGRGRRAQQHPASHAAARNLSRPHSSPENRQQAAGLTRVGFAVSRVPRAWRRSESTSIPVPWAQRCPAGGRGCTSTHCVLIAGGSRAPLSTCLCARPPGRAAVGWRGASERDFGAESLESALKSAESCQTIIFLTVSGDQEPGDSKGAVCGTLCAIHTQRRPDQSPAAAERHRRTLLRGIASPSHTRGGVRLPIPLIECYSMVFSGIVMSLRLRLGLRRL